MAFQAASSPNRPTPYSSALRRRNDGMVSTLKRVASGLDARSRRRRLRPAPASSTAPQRGSRCPATRGGAAGAQWPRVRAGSRASDRPPRPERARRRPGRRRWPLTRTSVQSVCPPVTSRTPRPARRRAAAIRARCPSQLSSNHQVDSRTHRTVRPTHGSTGLSPPASSTGWPSGVPASCPGRASVLVQAVADASGRISSFDA